MRTYTKLSHLVVFIVALLLIGCSASNSGASGSQYISVNGGSQLSESNPFALNLQSTSNQVTQSNVPLNSTLNLDFYSALDLKKINKDGGVSKYIQLKSQLGTLTTYKDSYISQNNKNIVLNTDKLATNTNYKLMVNYLPLANGGYITGFISFGSGATNPLTVTMLSPKNNESNIGVNPVITFTFNQLANNVNFNNIHLYRNSILASNLESITNIVQDTLGNYSFVPLNSLTKNINYYVVFESGIKDSVGNSLQTATFKFNTIDNSKPTATLLTPVQNQRNVSIYPLFAVYFSESVVGYESGVVVKDSAGNSISLARFDFQNNLLSFNSLKPLEPNSLYSINLESKITDLSGNRLDNYTFYFTTGESMYLTAYLLNPIPNSLNNVNNPKFRIRFSNFLGGNPTLTDNFKLLVTSESSSVISLSNLQQESQNLTIFNFFSDNLFNNTQYSLKISNIVDLFNNQLPPTTFNFTTGVNSSNPIATMKTPVNGASVNWDIGGNISVGFNNTMKTATGTILVCNSYPDLYESINCMIPQKMKFNTTSNTLEYSSYPFYPNQDYTITLAKESNQDIFGSFIESTTFRFSTNNNFLNSYDIKIISPNITSPLVKFNSGESFVFKFQGSYYPDDIIRNYQYESGKPVKPFSWVSSSSIVLKEAATGYIVKTNFVEAYGESNTYTMILQENLKPNTRYQIYVARNILSSNYYQLLKVGAKESFATVNPLPPTVSPYGFSSGQTVGSGFVPSIQFNQQVNLTASQIKLTNDSGTNIPFTLSSASNNVWVINPNTSLTTPGVTYYLQVDKSVANIYGITLGQYATFIFYTYKNVAPFVSYSYPAAYSKDQSLNTPWTIHFNEAVLNNCDQSSYKVEVYSNYNWYTIPFTISNCTNSSATITPNDTGYYSAEYYLYINNNNSIVDNEGAKLPWTRLNYTTIPAPDKQPPTVWYDGGRDRVFYSADTMRIYFSEPVTGVHPFIIYIERCTRFSGLNCVAFSGIPLTNQANYTGSGIDTSQYYDLGPIINKGDLNVNSKYCIRVSSLTAITDVAGNSLNYPQDQCRSYAGY